ncbi:MAG: L-aspartate oxidase [Bacteroidota bacterium]
MRINTDFLVIGSGIAGLGFALKAAEFGRVMVITKVRTDETNTKYAQGGIAAVTYSPDSIEKHVADTLDAGAGCCDERIVRMVITEGIERVNELIAWGARFDRKNDGTFDLAREGGHTQSRILHARDSTGAEIERTLLDQVEKHPNITLHPHLFAVDLITQHHFGMSVTRGMLDLRCFGAYVLDTNTGEVGLVASRVVLIATGGAGQLYRVTTNPLIATGDGIAMVDRAQGHLADMEFIQFHPTALYRPGHNPAFLISEAVRGAGAVLRNREGHDFVRDEDPRGSLAPRDIVARAIDRELSRTGAECVYLDCSSIGPDEFATHFPGILSRCRSLGIDPMREPIPVAPAAHYLCGGISVDEHGCTGIEGLYAAGECTRTGLHGANRLASNSLLEAAVYAHRAALHAAAHFPRAIDVDVIPDWNSQGTCTPREQILISQTRRELQSLMSAYVGIVRSDDRLNRANERVRMLLSETEKLYSRSPLSVELCELRNMVLLADRIITAALNRRENVGLHFNIDLPVNSNA